MSYDWQFLVREKILVVCIHSVNLLGEWRLFFLITGDPCGFYFNDSVCCADLDWNGKESDWLINCYSSMDSDYSPIINPALHKALATIHVTLSDNVMDNFWISEAVNHSCRLVHHFYSYTSSFIGRHLHITMQVYVDIFAICILLLGGALACYGKKLSLVMNWSAEPIKFKMHTLCKI